MSLKYEMNLRCIASHTMKREVFNDYTLFCFLNCIKIQCISTRGIQITKTIPPPAKSVITGGE